MATVVSVGYERRSVAEMIEALRELGVSTVVDVREKPVSRRTGFSKRALAEQLERGGIDYLHLREAGNPHRKEKADIERCLQLYRDHLARMPELVTQIGEALPDGVLAMLCYEREHHSCHRSVLLEELDHAGFITDVIQME